MAKKPLYVIAVCANPVRYQSRYRLFRNFLSHMDDLRLPVLVVELAFGQRPFMLQDAGAKLHLKLRTGQELWHKENLINLGIDHLSRIQPNAEYVAWIDGDVHFQSRDVGQETVEQLQHYDVVQMWSDAIDMGPQGQFVQRHVSFMYQYRTGQTNPSSSSAGSGPLQKAFWHPGYAWAASLSSLRRLPLRYPLFDQGILGAGDHHMAQALVGKASLSLPAEISAGYRAQVEQWGKLVELHIRRNVGYVPGLITHFWHGAKANRKYVERWDILKSTQFDPTRDLVRNSNGLYELVDFMDERSIRLRDLIRAYFRQRDEDSTSLE
jgi:hypothetical protein